MRPEQAFSDLRRATRPLLVILPAAGLVLGFGALLIGEGRWSGPIWAFASIPVLGALLAQVITSLKRGDVGLDIVAALSMTGALVLGENLAAVVVALMYAGGQYLESFAEGRANREMTSLLARVPRTTACYRDYGLEEIPLQAVEPGQRLLVRRGEVVPVDGIVSAGRAILDQSALTGESLPAQRGVGESVMSGSTNAGDPFDLLAIRRAAESTYAGIVRLIEAAQRSKAPIARLADKFAIAFLGLTIVLAALAWLISGDPLRALAVFVIATPCPLLLAVPVALISGVSRAAKGGILVKGAGALEMLAQIRVLVIDKTGTLTQGNARLVEILPVGSGDPNELLRLAASLDQASKHVIAQAILTEAQKRNLHLSVPKHVEEMPGEGITGMVEGKTVIIGGQGYVSQRVANAQEVFALHEYPAGSMTVAIAIDGKPGGLLVLGDTLRAGATQVIENLRRSGICRIVVASGDRWQVVEAVTTGLPFDAIHGDLSPEGKIDIIQEEKRHGCVMMVGDGVNDAPALAAADLGVAMGEKGAAAAAEAADVVLLADELERILLAITIARRSKRIALQSVYVGIGLSVAGMIMATFGYVTPVLGALVQEAIDVAVILNALRALRIPYFSRLISKASPPRS